MHGMDPGIQNNNNQQLTPIVQRLAAFLLACGGGEPRKIKKVQKFTTISMSVLAFPNFDDTTIKELLFRHSDLSETDLEMLSSLGMASCHGYYFSSDHSAFLANRLQCRLRLPMIVSGALHAEELKKEGLATLLQHLRRVKGHTYSTFENFFELHGEADLHLCLFNSGTSYTLHDTTQHNTTHLSQN